MCDLKTDNCFSPAKQKGQEAEYLQQNVKAEKRLQKHPQGYQRAEQSIFADRAKTLRSRKHRHTFTCVHVHTHTRIYFTTQGEKTTQFLISKDNLNRSFSKQKSYKKKSIGCMKGA